MVDTVSDVDPTMLHDDDRSAWVALNGGQQGDRVRSRDAGRPAEAAAYGRVVCAVAPSLSSVRVHRQLTGLGAALHPHRDAAEVAGFLGQLATFPATAHKAPVWPV